MRTRKPCPGCGEVDRYRKVDAVCPSCKALLGYARSTVKTKTRAKFVGSLPWAPHSLAYLHGAGDVGRELQVDFYDLLLELSEPAPPGVTGSSGFNRIKREGGFSYGDPRIFDRRVAVRARRVYLTIVRAIRAANLDGKKDGSHFVSRLAAGEVTAQEYNEALLQLDRQAQEAAEGRWRRR
jgi:hypothetical protein